MDESYEINILDILNLIKVNWIKILAAAIIGGIIAGVATVTLVTPKYQSTVKMIIINKQSVEITSSDIVTSTWLVNDAMQLLQSRDLMELVADDVDWDITDKEILSEVSVSTPEDSRILYITVTDPIPERARDIAYSIYKKASMIFVDIIDVNAVNLIEEPIVPTTPSSPNTTKNIAVGVFLGALLVILIVFLKQMLNNKVCKVEDVENRLNLTLLAAIPVIEDGAEKGKRKKRSSGYFKKRNKNKR